jgi:hypothetical protein
VEVAAESLQNGAETDISVEVNIEVNGSGKDGDLYVFGALTKYDRKSP